MNKEPHAKGLSYQQKVNTLAETRSSREDYRKQGASVVFTNGCFDLLHPGHVRYLAMARALGDHLLVGLNSDASVRRLKGEGRPVQSEDARAEVLAALASVDHVVIFEDDDPLSLILELRPEILAKGADWAAEEIIGATEVQAWGGRVERVPLVEGESTTRLVAKMKN